MVCQTSLGASGHLAAVLPAVAAAEPGRRGHGAAAGRRPHHPRPGGRLHRLWRGGRGLRGCPGHPRRRRQPSRRKDQDARRRTVVGDHDRHNRRIWRSASCHRGWPSRRGRIDDRRHHIAWPRDGDAGVVDRRTRRRRGHCQPGRDKSRDRGTPRRGPATCEVAYRWSRARLW
jgi:hypothetical protein